MDIDYLVKARNYINMADDYQASNLSDYLVIEDADDYALARELFTVSYSNRAMYGGFSSGKTKTPGRKSFLLSVSYEYKTELELSDSVKF